MGIYWFLLGNLGKEALTKINIPLAKVSISKQFSFKYNK